ncbi:glycogen/starch/alpha-glucan phosphorylase [Candidatus Uabimicrobium sp. HlEnr_7]|uniref:glycogen/starch/alpha-glucan phosphorylase n=1 Tax=Candidatus Uabimicrobium helgolandensis TaxID=3095367 RepID=UPI003558A1FF
MNPNWDNIDSQVTIQQESIASFFVHYLKFFSGKDRHSASELDIYNALAYTIRDHIIEKWLETKKLYNNNEPKRVYYLSMEYLLGRLFTNNIINLGADEQFKKGLKKLGVNWEDFSTWERESALGNGGLGRLAACFLDSMATLNLPAVGYGLRYEYGIFRQDICQGYQVEEPDEWLKFDNIWEMKRVEHTVPVHFGGEVEVYHIDGVEKHNWCPSYTVLGIPYDMPVVGYGNNIINTLRLWSAKVSEEFNLQDFNQGNYIDAVSEKVEGETLTKVLYPDDRTESGRELRFRQQYFFVCCSIQDIIRKFKKESNDFRDFPKKAVIQLNDTHPSISVSELMRILVDEEDINWDLAWEITSKSFGYTNHTILPEALEKWPVEFFQRHLPRHLQIIYELNQRFLQKISVMHPGDNDILRRMSLVEEYPQKKIRMAHLAIIGSTSVNGVSEIHSEILKSQVMPDFYKSFPNRFNNKTNGITPRRWLLQANPDLADLITQKIGKDWVCDLSKLKQLEKYVDDKAFSKQFRKIKATNKEKLAQLIKEKTGVVVKNDAIFDVQIKRIHEYKRQLMNILHVIHLYCELRENKDHKGPQRVFLFAGKAAPGYYMAKMIIKLILNVAKVINNDELINDKIKVVFIPNYKVSMAEVIIPATDISEQISTAGKEASGTGNMKFALNGALTIGTLDGANIEIMNEVGKDNIFTFGLDIDEIKTKRQSNYQPNELYEQNPKIKKVVDLIQSNFFSFNESGIFDPICNSLLSEDQYFIFADFDSYLDCHEKILQEYRNEKTWTKKAILNVARMGKFSSDRTIKEYAEDIWKVSPVFPKKAKKS